MIDWEYYIEKQNKSHYDDRVYYVSIIFFVTCIKLN